MAYGASDIPVGSHRDGIEQAPELPAENLDDRLLQHGMMIPRSRVTGYSTGGNLRPITLGSGGVAGAARPEQSDPSGKRSRTVVLHGLEMGAMYLETPAKLGGVHVVRRQSGAPSFVQQ